MVILVYRFILLYYTVETKLERILALQTGILRLRCAATRPPDLNVRPCSTDTRVPDLCMSPCSAETCPSFWNVGTWTNFWELYMPLSFEESLLCFYSSFCFADSQLFFSLCDTYWFLQIQTDGLIDLMGDLMSPLRILFNTRYNFITVSKLAYVQ